jgi:hypothetical protein
MPTWGEILTEIRGTKAPVGTGPDFDSVRRRYLREVSRHTGRATIFYGTSFLDQKEVPPAGLQLSLGDIQGFMEAVAKAPERELDLILLSPGGSAEAAESIVEYLRKRFDHIRVFVPVAAMSAATMLALAADEIVLGQHSQLGPIDPQLIIQTPEGPRSAPAKAILDQFELAKEQCRDPANLAAWMPILRSYAPGLLTQCENQRQLAQGMVASWLEAYMFARETGAAERAQTIASWFADYDNFHSHGRRVGIDAASELGLKVTPLEADDKLQDAVLSVHHAAAHTFSGTPAVKLIEDHLGQSFILMRSTGVLAAPASPPASPPALPTGDEPPLSRAERRRQGR